jgi:phage recombination protein Bet
MSNEPEEERGIITYTPIGEKEPIKLSLSIAKRHIISPTKSGAWPSDKEIYQFLMLCRARGLNPFLGDCVITGYDTANQGPQFAIITAKSALDKRADLHPEFSGIESGIVVLKKGETIERREGAIILPNEELLGGWAVVFRKDRPDHPIKHDVNLEAYDKKRAIWNTDKPGMIVKCAEAGCLRKAFPNSFADLYLAEEEKAIEAIRAEVTVVETKTEKAAPVPSGFERKAIPQESTVQRAESLPAAPQREEQPVQRTEAKPVSRRQPAPAPEPPTKAAPPADTKPPFDDPEYTTDPAPAPAKETAPAAPAAPAPAPTTEEPASLELRDDAGPHAKLLADSNLSKEALVKVARDFFGKGFETYEDIPEMRIEQMLTNLDDVIEQAKA